MKYPDWVNTFDGQDLPRWNSEKDGEVICSFLNYFLHQVPGFMSSRFHLLNRHPSGRLYLHLLRRD